DERSLPSLALLQNAPPEGGRPVLHAYKYPIPGDPLPMATFVAIEAASGRMRMFNEFQSSVSFSSPFQAEARIAWFDARGNAWLIRFDRYWKQIDLIRLDLAQGTGQVILSETTSA